MRHQSEDEIINQEDHWEGLAEEKKIREAKIRNAAPEMFKLIKSIVDKRGKVNAAEYKSALRLYHRISS